MTKGYELEGFAGFEPNSFFMCTETSPRCYVIQRVNEMPGCASTEIVDTPLKDVTNGSEPMKTTPTTISTADLAPVADTPGSDAAPTPFLFPWWFTNECRTALMNIPTTSSPYSRPDTSASNNGHNNNHGSPNNNNNNENDSTRSKTPEVLTMEQLRERLKRQLEYYFSRENLINDRYLRCQMDSDRYVPIKTVSTFPKIKQLTNDLSLIVDVLRESKQVQVDESGEKVRPLCKRCTIILRDIGTEEDEDEVRYMFENCEQKYQSIIYGLNNSWYVTFPDEEATKMAFLHLKNLGKTFNGKRFIQPVHARIKDGGPPEANSNRMTPVPSTQGHVMFVSPEGPRIMTTSTGHIVVHELPWEGGGNHAINQSHRSRSNTNTFTAAMALSATGEGLGMNGEIGEALRQLGYAPKAIFRPFTAPRSVYSNAHTLTPSPAVSPSIANADDQPRCDSLGNAMVATGNALNSTADERLLANSPDSARLSPSLYSFRGDSGRRGAPYNNNNNMDVTNKLPLDLDASPDNDSPLMASPENEIEAVPSHAYMLSFGRQRITDAPKINTKGRQSPLFYINPVLAGVVPPAPYFMTMTNGLYGDGKMMSSSPNPYYIDQFSAPIISDINPAFYVDYDPSLMIQTDASPHLATSTTISNSPKENGGDNRNNNRLHHGGNPAFGRSNRGFARAPPAKSPRLSGVNAVPHDVPFRDHTGHSSPRYRGGGGGGRPWPPHYQRGWKSDEARHGGPQGGQYSSRGHNHNHFNNDSIPSSRFNSSPYGVDAGRANSNDADSTASASLIRPRILRNSSTSDYHNNHHQHHHLAADVVHANNQSQRPAYENWRPGLSEQHINSSNSNHLPSNCFAGSKNAGRNGGKPLSSLFSSPSYPTRLHHHSSCEGSHPESFLTRSNPLQPQQPLQQQHTNIDVSQLRPLSESYGCGTGGVHHPQRSFHQQKHSMNGELRQARLSRYNPRGGLTNGAQNQTGGESVAAVEEVGQLHHHHQQQQYPNRYRIERPINQHRLAKSRHYAESEKESSDCGGERIDNEKSAALAEYNFVEIEFPSLLSDCSDTGCHVATQQESQSNLKDAERAPSDVDEHACVWRNAAESHKPQFSEIVSGTKPLLSVDGTEQPSSHAAAARDDDGSTEAGSENTVSAPTLDAMAKRQAQSATKSYAQATQKGPKDE